MWGARRTEYKSATCGGERKRERDRERKDRETESEEKT